METMAIMAVISILGSIISGAITDTQQNKEFNKQDELLKAEQDFQADREDIAYERNSIPNQYQQMLDAGFNPILAASSILGGNGVSAAQSGSSPAAPTVNSAIGALSQMMGQGNKSLYDLFKETAEIKNIQANTEKTEVETGIMPRDYQLRLLTVDQQIKVWDASVQRTKAAQHLDDAQTRLINQQNLYYGRMAEAQITAYQNQAYEAFSDAMLKLEQIDTEKAKQNELGTQSAVNVATAANLQADTILKETENSTEYYKSERERIAMEFEKKLHGIPLSADAQRYVHSLAMDGNIEGMQDFYMNIFTTAKNQQMGTEQGTASRFGLPFDLFKGEPNQTYKPFGWVQYNPIWNPSGRYSSFGNN